MSEKRRDYISWDEYFMGVAMLTGMRSKDPNTQVGACIVSADHKIYRWDTTDCRQAVRMMNSHGDGKALRWRTNTCLPHTVS